MKCTVCTDSTLQSGTLEDRLPCMSCASCGGSWLEALAYSEWRSLQQKDVAPEHAQTAGGTPVNLVSGEAGGLKFCPQCAHILIKYRVGHEINFSVDRCGYCTGVWLDKNEWQLLKTHELHGHIYDIFSQGWQSEVRAAEHRQAMEDILRERLGTDYDEFHRIAEWLNKHPKSDEIYALLYGTRKKQ